VTGPEVQVGTDGIMDGCILGLLEDSWLGLEPGLVDTFQLWGRRKNKLQLDWLTHLLFIIVLGLSY
jgi:hypothetical protein